MSGKKSLVALGVIEAHLIGDHWSVFVDGLRAGLVEEDSKGNHLAVGGGKTVAYQSFTDAVQHLARALPDDLRIEGGGAG